MAAALVRGAARELAWLPSFQCVRHGSKAVTRHKKAMHFERQKIMALTKYIPPKPSDEKCLQPRTRPEDTGKENLLERFLCTQLSAVLQNSKMIAVFQRNSIGAEDFLLFRHRLFKHDLHIKVFPNQVTRKVLDQFQLQAMLPLFIGHTFLVVSSEAKVKEMLQAARTVPQTVLLGACVENRLLSRQGVVNYSKLPSKETLQGQLVSTLGTMTSETSRLLTHHSSHLSSLLKQHSKEDVKSD
ncbi:PREDICTED: 39S ribosomal protein L10, mitochondrial [Nanorana parkeri]|uniref:39S ribosomal protein L10, mitochondrial n=1 Tax=Nanorana parkeri TaxID=125878 RepID=UPI000854AD45|nr:PREDICTED: 39S ribosomal protein L10, mitochondrial [Nanorana parkeri]